jgi:hypothetical protein
VSVFIADLAWWSSPDEALANYQEALELCRSTGMALAEVTVTSSIGLTHERRREPEKAL